MSIASGISLVWSGDLTLTATGDIAVSSGTQAGVERVLRRLFTAPGTYIFHPSYGCGLPAMVGQAANENQIQAIILEQMQMEAVVSQDPAPAVSVTVNPDGTVWCSIQYVDAPTGQTVPLAFTVPTPQQAI